MIAMEKQPSPFWKLLLSFVIVGAMFFGLVGLFCLLVKLVPGLWGLLLQLLHIPND
jgi:hypothetical protein